MHLRFTDSITKALGEYKQQAIESFMDVASVKFMTVLFTYTAACVKLYDTLSHSKKRFVGTEKSKNRELKM